MLAIRKVLNYLASRRRFNRIDNIVVRLFSKNISTYKINREDYEPQGSLFSIPIQTAKLDDCFKSGGWFQPVSFINFLLWNPFKFQYFSNKYPTGGLSSSLNSVKLKKWENVRLYPRYWQSNHLNFNCFKIRKQGRVHQRELIVHDELLCMDMGGADSFQHFIGDCLPLLIPFVSEISRNRTLKIGLPSNIRSLNVHSSLLRLVGIENDIVLLDKANSHVVKSLFAITAAPSSRVYAIPCSFIHEMSGLVRLQSESRKKIILFKRNEKTRNIRNFSQLVANIESLAIKLGLVFEIIDTNMMSLMEIRDALSTAYLTIAPHGGANYNLIFMPANSFFLEFIPTSNTNTIDHLARSSGLNYVPIPINFDFYEYDFEIPTKVIEGLNVFIRQIVVSSN